MKKLFKGLISVLIISSLCMCLFACGSEKQAEEQAAASEASETVAASTAGTENTQAGAETTAKKEKGPEQTYTVGDTEFKMCVDVDSYITDGVANFIQLFEDLGLSEGQRDMMEEIKRYMATVPDTEASTRLIQEKPRDDGNYEFYTMKFTTSDKTAYTFTFEPGQSEDLSINIALSDDIENRMIPMDAFIIYCYAAEQLSDHPDSIDLTPFESHLKDDTYQF